MDRKLLGIYLNDHLAAAVVGGELAKRAASSNEGSDLGDFLTRLASEFGEERQVIKALLRHFELPESRVKARMAWGAEKAGRLKLNGQLTGYSPLSRLVELDGLTLSVVGKLGMWQAVSSTQAGLESFGLDRLIAQGEAQLGELERRRREAAVAALGAAPAGA